MCLISLCVKVEGPYGLEISPAERYDVLVKWDKTATDKTHIMHIERCVHMSKIHREAVG
jgi:hypothetical protein